MRRIRPPERIAFGPSRIHGTGAFARGPIPAGERIIEYVGRRISKAESLKLCSEGNEYIFALSDSEDLDGNVPWNPARFLNHSCQPNCEVEFVGGSLWVIARRDINANEELTFNYGFDLADYRDYPCNCGAPGCFGYIIAEEYFRFS